MGEENGTFEKGYRGMFRERALLNGDQEIELPFGGCGLDSRFGSGARKVHSQTERRIGEQGQ